jgi:hypothetical protein
MVANRADENPTSPKTCSAATKIRSGVGGIASFLRGLAMLLPHPELRVLSSYLDIRGQDSPLTLFNLINSGVGNPHLRKNASNFSAVQSWPETCSEAVQQVWRVVLPPP